MPGARRAQLREHLDTAVVARDREVEDRHVEGRGPSAAARSTSASASLPLRAVATS